MGFRKKSNPDPVKIVNKLGAKWSPDLDAYTSGKIHASQIRCALCSKAPCECPPFGMDEYFAMLDRVHGSNR